MAQFSEEVFKTAGASDVLPLVMGSLDADKVRAVQFLRAGRVRMTFQDSQTCSQILEDGLDLGDLSVQLFPADERLRTVYIRDLPVEIDDEVVSSFLADFGEVLSVDYCFLTTIPPSVMAIVWLKFYLIAISRSLLKSMDAVAVSGTYASQSSVLFAESLVILPQPAHSLVAAGAVISSAIWPGSVRRLGAHCFLFLVLLILQWKLMKFLLPLLPLLFLLI